MYHLKISGEDESKTNIEMIEWYQKLVEEFPIIYIEDGLAEDDWDGFTEMNQRLGEKIKSSEMI